MSELALSCLEIILEVVARLCRHVLERASDFTYASHKFAKLQIMISGKLGVLGVPTTFKVGLPNVVS